METNKITHIGYCTVILLILLYGIFKENIVRLNEEVEYLKTKISTISDEREATDRYFDKRISILEKQVK